ncbi:toll/interleukin-1 receptor domain-containing protein [Corynebacterium suedekumii]|nr:toll/interleukin-1 receptor domain-containing protein [Corynebacterium suedekumii]
MDAEKFVGFWSYVQEDDHNERGRITLLLEDLRDQFRLISGDDIEVFHDRSSLSWGDDWRSVIDEYIEATAFFIPIITPRYFKSSACRNEIEYFLEISEKYNLGKLLVPIYYAKSPELEAADGSSDPLVDKVSKTQWVDWRSLRLEDRDSSDYRKAVAGMADRLHQANTEISETRYQGGVNAGSEPGAELEVDDAPGLIDNLAQMEESISNWIETITAITCPAIEIGEIFEWGNSEVDKTAVKNANFAGRVRVMRDVSKKLDQPTSKIEKGAVDFTAQLNEVNVGIRSLIELLEMEESPTDETLTAAAGFLDQLESLDESSSQGLGSIRRHD